MAFCNLTYTSPYPAKMIGHLLFDSLKIQSRELPVSDILEERLEQVVQLIQNWDENLEAEILAENFYLDMSREDRMSEIQEVLDEAGTILELNEEEPYNQLRGHFKYQTENGFLSIYFTLSPEKMPRVQDLYVSFQSKDSQ